MHIQRSESAIGCLTPSLSTLLARGRASHCMAAFISARLAPGIFLSILTTVVTVLLAKTSHQPQDSVFLSQIKCLFINQITYLNCRDHRAPRNSKLYLSQLVNLPASFSRQPCLLCGKHCSRELAAVLGVGCLSGAVLFPGSASWFFSLLSIVPEWGY